MIATKTTKRTTNGRKLVGSRSTWGAGTSKQGLHSCWEVGDHKLRLNICLPLDSSLRQYADASSWFEATAEVWSKSALAWQNVAILCLVEVAPAAHKEEQGKCVVDEAALLACETALLDRAAWALGVKSKKGAS